MAALLPLAAVGLGLAGCTDDTAGYQFATDPRPTRPAATPAVVVTTPPQPTTEPAAAPRPFAELVVPRGAPDRIYFDAGTELWTVAASGSQPGRVFSPDLDESIVAVSPSPSGDRVAVLVAGSDGTSSVRVFAPDGAVDEAFDQIPPPALEIAPAASPAASPAAAATPVAESSRTGTSAEATPMAGSASPRSIDWSPQGDQLLVGFEPGGIVALAVGGERDVRTVLPVAAARSPRGAAWSPTGELVAFVTGGQAQDRQVLSLAEAESAAAPPRPLVDVPIGRAILGISWLPDGRSLLFTEGDSSATRSTNTDLWRIEADGDGRQLVASAGSAAPVADIDLFSPSPDGRSVAYTVVVPGEPRDAFHSLWIRDLAAGRAYPVQVPAGIDVTDLWWTSSGLVFRTTGDSGPGAPVSDSFELYRVGTDGESLPILRATVDSATPAATPSAD